MYEYSIKAKFFLITSAIIALIVVSIHSLDTTRLIRAVDSFAKYIQYRIDFSRENTDSKNWFAGLYGALFSSADWNTYTSADNRAANIPVLVYHGITKNNDGINISADRFREHMFALKKAGYTAITIQDFYDFIQQKKDLPPKSFLLTFDDGRKDSFYEADPILQVLNYHAVMFVITKYSLSNTPDNYYLTREELKLMQSSGRWDIQAHTQNGHDIYSISSNGKEGHFFTNRIWLSDKNRLESEEEYTRRITTDFRGAKEDIEKNLGIQSISFAFPFGDYGQNITNVKNAEKIVTEEARKEYKLAFYQTWPENGYRANVPEKEFLNRRISVEPAWSGNELISLLKSVEDKKLPFHTEFKNPDTSWLSMWGSLDIKDRGLDLRASKGSSGAATLLDGSQLWKNYFFTTHIDWQKGQSVSLMAHFKDNDNFTVCDFLPDTVRIEQTIHGLEIKLAEEKTAFMFPQHDMNIGISVNQNQIQCFIGNTLVAEANISENLNQGGVGLKIWDSSIENSEIIIKSVSVVDIDEQQTFLRGLPSYQRVNNKEQQIITTINPTPNPVIIEKPKESIIPTEQYKPLENFPIIHLINEDGTSKIYDSNFLNNSFEWKNIFGNLLFENGTMILRTDERTNSSLVILNGSQEWTNYKATSEIEWNKAGSVSLIGRYQDAKNYTSCSYTGYGAQVLLGTFTNGKVQTIANSGRLQISYIKPWESVRVGIEVRGREVSCMLNGEVVLHSMLDSVPNHGSFGLKTWDPIIGNTSIKIKYVHAEPVSI